MRLNITGPALWTGPGQGGNHMDSTKSPRLARGMTARARVALMMLTVAMSACGGGGGGSSPPPPPPPPPPAPAPTPAPTLSVKADAASVQAGDQPVGLHAMLGAASTSVTWTLTGPGTLSATTGSDVQYTPPDAEGLDTSQAATITITTFNFPSQSVDIAVAAIDRPGHHWTLARPSGNQYTDVAVGKEGFVATAFSVGLTRSDDGLTWTDIPLYPRPAAVAWGDAGWVGVTNQGVAWFSADSITWTKSPDAIPYGISRVAYGNHTYLAYDTYSNSAVSTDGVHWTPAAKGTAAVAFGNGKFMALRQNPLVTSYNLLPATSTDGIDWQPATNVANLYNIAFANGQFDASAGSWLYVTGDGATWLGSDAAPAYRGLALRGVGNTLFELGPQDMGVQLPGAGWQRVSTGDFLSTPAAVAANADRFVGVSSSGWIETSPDALHWNTQVEGSYGDLRVVEVVDGQFVALSDLNHVLRSADGVNWTKATLLAGSNTTPLYPTAIAHADRTVVAGVAAGLFPSSHASWIRSPDAGATWAAAATTGPAENVAGVVHDGFRFVSISASGKVFASPDGDAWGQIGTAPAPLSSYHGLVYGGGSYLAFADGAVATSPDGVSWTPVDANAFGIPISHVRTFAALWTGKQFVLMGNDAQSVGYANLFSAVSADGRAWTRKDRGVYDTPTSLAMCGNEIVGIGNNFLASSTDGLNWYPHAPVTGATQLNAVACSGGRFVGVGWASAIVTSTR
jgi:hypothetical protein